MSSHLGLQFQYVPPSMGEQYHSVTADFGDTDIGKAYAELGHRVRPAHIQWNAKEIRSIDVPPAFQRQGVATALWNEGHRLAEENARIPKPKHSSQRTTSGDAWARSVGGRLPQRKK